MPLPDPASLITSATVAASALASASAVATEPIAAVITSEVPHAVAAVLPSTATTTTPVGVQGPIVLPVGFALFAVFVGALAGSSFAAERKLDIAGLFMLAAANGLGGGILRDIIIDDGRIAAFATSGYLLAVVAGTFVSFFFASLYRRFGRLFFAFDGLSLGLFAVSGADKALAADFPLLPAIMLGVITGVGGGVMRDVMCGEVPQVARRGAFQSTAAAVGAAVYVLLVGWLGIVKAPAAVIAVVLVFALRSLSVVLGWQTPLARDYTPGWIRRVTRRLSSGEQITERFEPVQPAEENAA